MIILYSITFFMTFLCFLCLYLGLKKRNLEFKLKNVVSSLRLSVQKPLELASIYMLIFFVILIFLPLFWGLSLFLKTDGNVLAVLITMAWGYNLIKYTFPISKEEKK